MRLGDLDALKAEVVLMFGDNTHITESVCELIDNALSVKPCENCDLYFKAMTKAELDKMPMISKKHKGGAV